MSETVHSVSFFTDPSRILRIGSLDVSFEQHSEGATPALFGRFIYRSSAVPEPASVVLMGGGALGLVICGLRRVGAAR